MVIYYFVLYYPYRDTQVLGDWLHLENTCILKNIPNVLFSITYCPVTFNNHIVCSIVVWIKWDLLKKHVAHSTCPRFCYTMVKCFIVTSLPAVYRVVQCCLEKYSALVNGIKYSTTVFSGLWANILLHPALLLFCTVGLHYKESIYPSKRLFRLNDSEPSLEQIWIVLLTFSFIGEKGHR